MTDTQDKPQVLIVDDDFFLLDMYAVKFSHSGFQVVTASSGTEAMQKIKANPGISVMLLDIVMPELDGFEFLSKLNEEKLADRSLVIFLSNLSQEEDIKKAKDLRAVEFIVKANNTPAQVVEKVEEVITTHKAKKKKS